MGIRLATADDVPALIPVLARAFATDPFVGWLVRADARRDAGFARCFALSLRVLALPHNQVFTTDDCSGAALWIPPGKWKMGLARELWQVRHWAAICGWKRMLSVQLATAPLIAAHPRTPHHYLYVLGVDTAVQGKGLGRTLLAPMLERCDREHMPAYLETATERNLGFYKNLGFAITGEIAVKRGPRVWLMWREPRHVSLLGTQSS
jgi:ribosomal protein S18 acetylase RimI-like enzyme